MRVKTRARTRQDHTLRIGRRRRCGTRRLSRCAWSGIYNIAASRGHWTVVEWALAFGMRNSVQHARTRHRGAAARQCRSGQSSAPRIFTAAAPIATARPASPVSPIAWPCCRRRPTCRPSMRPWSDRELFWIVKHGIKYTGMPGWVAQERDDEVWAVVAFLKRLPALDAAGYRDTGPRRARIPPQSGREIATTEADHRSGERLRALPWRRRARPSSKLVPILHGQPAEFLAAALAGLCRRHARQRHHAAGRRRPAAGRTCEQARGLLRERWRRAASRSQPDRRGGDRARPRSWPSDGDP